MFFWKRNLFGLSFLLVLFSATAFAQSNSNFEVLSGNDLTKMVPTSFYFAGQSAPTQMRNAASARVGKDRHVVVGLVDTSGYSTEISGKYEGFFITDSPVAIGGKTIATGAYGFGFSADGNFRLFDLSSKEIFSAKAVTDAEMTRPRPLMMTAENKGVRFYKGKFYVVIAPK